MYKRSAEGWAKHWDFILLDTLCLQISFIIAYIVSAVLVFILIGFVLILIVWIWALIDSIKSTEAINRGEFVEDKLF